MSKNKQVSTTIAPEKFAVLEEYRWTNRINKTGDVLTLAVDEFIANHNITVADESTDAPAADAPAPEKSDAPAKGNK